MFNKFFKLSFMTKYFGLLLTLIVLRSNTANAQISMEEERVMMCISNSFDDIFSRHDTSTIKKYYTSDFILLENGVTWNNDSVRNYMVTTAAKWKKFRDEKHTISRVNRFQFVDFAIYSSVATVAYHNYGTFKRDQKQFEVHWLESAVLVKYPEGWKIRSLHSTKVEEREL
jgi:hypothetical protein